ncbi:MAG TPA: mevalonate kinase [Polyangiales bacterium]|nr:mevalonate kinase [Polyangiales bacterium]
MAFGCGKVILLGEHSVVYGRPALAASLASMGAEASAEPWPHARLEVEPWGVAFDVDAEQEEQPADAMQRAFRALLAGYGKPWPRARVRVQLSIPGAAGLGGSAALSVAVVRALDALRGSERTPEAVAAAALAAEYVFHGTPSGIDTAMAAGSGVALFRKDAPLEQVALERPLTLVVGHSGEVGQTKITVASVKQQYQRDPKKLEQTFGAIEALVLNARSALQHGDVADLGKLMSENQKLLNTLLLSTSRLEEMCKATENAGALGAKLTGGGGGGCMIALCAGPELAGPVLEALRKLGRDAFLVQVQP